MLVTKWTHACVRLEQDGRVLVVDPGIWTEPEAFDGADAVLLTHAHDDHADLPRIARLDVPVVAPEGADLGALEARRVRAGDVADLAGFTVEAFGGSHLPVLDDRPGTVNLGYLVDGTVYHPGDALDVPDRPVQTLLVPMQGSWLLTRDAVEFVRRVSPRRAVGIHDGQVNERAVTAIGHWLRQAAPCGFDWLPPGTTVDGHGDGQGDGSGPHGGEQA